jgi:hypothetical protein
MHDLRATAAHDFQGHLSEFQHRKLAGVTDIHRADGLFLIHQTQKAFNQIIDIAKRASLRAVTIDRDVFALERLYDEIGNHPPIVRMHARTVSIKDPHDPDIDAVLTVIVEKQGLGAALALVVARPHTDGINVPPIRFRLRVYGGIAVNFTRAGLEYSSANAFGQTEAIDCAHHRRLGGLDGVILVVWWRSRSRQIVDLVDLVFKRIDHIVPDQFKVRVTEKMGHIGLTAGKKVIHTDNVMPLLHQPVAEMRT